MVSGPFSWGDRKGREMTEGQGEGIQKRARDSLRRRKEKRPIRAVKGSHGIKDRWLKYITLKLLTLTKTIIKVFHTP